MINLKNDKENAKQKYKREIKGNQKWKSEWYQVYSDMIAKLRDKEDGWLSQAGETFLPPVRDIVK